MAETKLLTGWGRTPQSTASVHTPESATDIHLDDGERGHLARGLGRSYGDASLNSGGVVWDTTTMQSLAIDEANALARVGAGVSYLELLQACVPLGLFPPVTPGTKFVTMGGAIAADVHGKNHHRDGSIGRHLTSLTVMDGNGDIVQTRPGDDLFRATVGGMGLTGIVLEAEIRMLRISSPDMTVATSRTHDLADTLEVMVAHDNNHQYAVAWVDLTHPSNTGRGVVSFGDHATKGDLGEWEPPRQLASVPDLIPSGLINRPTVRAFNELWFRKAPRERFGQLQTIEQFFYPLDVAGGWNRLYGRAGMIQHQMVVPTGREDIVEATVAALQRAPVPPSLVVLKRFGEGSGLLSFPIAGWTLAVDFPAGDRGLSEVLDDVDRRVAEAGGRIYLAKDSRLDKSVLPRMYPELDEWRDLADKADPMRRFRSDLDRRLGLRAPR